MTRLVYARAALYALAACALLCCAAAPAAAKGSNFDPGRVRLVDTFRRPDGQLNALFRGNLPLRNGAFAYDELMATLSSVLGNQTGATIASNAYLVDYSFLNKIAENSDLQTEINFFKQNPTRGELVNYVLIGTLLNPDSFPEDMRLRMARTLGEWSVDKLPELLPTVHARLMDASSPRPLVIYYHCEAGEDRTGEFSASYYMQYLHMSMQQAIDIDDHIEDRNIRTMSRNASVWYCLYLREALHYPVDCSFVEPTH